MENDNLIPKCNRPDHAFYDQDSVGGEDPNTGIRVKFGVRHRPVNPGESFSLELKLDHYLIIEKPIRLTHTELEKKFPWINSIAKIEKPYPPEAGRLIEEFKKGLSSGNLSEKRVRHIARKLSKYQSKARSYVAQARKVPGRKTHETTLAKRKRIASEVESCMRPDGRSGATRGRKAAARLVARKHRLSWKTVLNWSRTKANRRP